MTSTERKHRHDELMRIWVKWVENRTIEKLAERELMTVNACTNVLARMIGKRMRQLKKPIKK